MINVAKIINTRGLKGECKVWLYTDVPYERFEKGNVLMLDGKTPLTVASFSMSKGLGFVRFEEITTIEQAESIKNHLLQLDETALPEPDEDEFYYHQLEGCSLVDEEGTPRGVVSDILETGAHLVLRVKDGDSTWLLPFVEAFVLDVDTDNKVITFKDMEGLR